MKDGNIGPCPPLIFKGCEDHITNLASKEFEKRTITRLKSWNKSHLLRGDQLLASWAVIKIMGKIRSDPYHRAFRAFVREHGEKPPLIERYSETRYSSIDILSLRFFQLRPFIFQFLHKFRSLLTKEDLEALKALLDPEVSDIIKTRALCAHHVLLPTMHRAVEVTTKEIYATKMQKIEENLNRIAYNPSLLASLPLPEKQGTLTNQLESLERDIDKLLALPEQSPISPELILPADLLNSTLDELDDDENSLELTLPRETVLPQPDPFPASLVCLDPPSLVPSSISIPTAKQRSMVMVSDAAMSFLYHQRKHGSTWRNTDSLATFTATSRHVERMFAVTKIFLARNPNLRIELINSLISLHDLSILELCQIWEAHHSEQVKIQARNVLKSNPKVSDIDTLCFQNLATKASEEEQKQISRGKKRNIEESLIEAGLINQGQRASKKLLIEYLAQRGENRADLNKLKVGEVREKMARNLILANQSLITSD